VSDPSIQHAILRFSLKDFISRLEYGDQHRHAHWPIEYGEVTHENVHSMKLHFRGDHVLLEISMSDEGREAGEGVE